MTKSPQPSAAESAEEICSVRITLLDTDPPIWREVEVPTAITLKTLHEVVQAAMGWFDQHLWEFTVGKQRYGLALGQDWGDPPRKDAAKVRLREVLGPRRTTIEYLYDFGDSWEHRLIVTGVRPGEAGVRYPRYVAGERAAPPEDCGGTPGFYHALEALADASHPDRADIAEWFGEFDADQIDEVPLKVALGRIANRRRAGGKRAPKPGA
jgi:hypothetical protein